jgi:hypothetical protein
MLDESAGLVNSQTTGQDRGSISIRRLRIPATACVTSLPVIRFTLASLLVLVSAVCSAENFHLIGRRGPVTIVTAPSPSQAEQFAAEELARYLHQMTGAAFPIRIADHQVRTASSLIIGKRALEQMHEPEIPPDLGDDGFIVRVSAHQVALSGNTDRATLYAVYAFLENLGCRWFAPNFDFYGAATGEYVPHRTAPELAIRSTVERPAFRWRKLYVEEGRSHNAHNLAQLVEWMPKARMNVLDIPADYQHQGRTRWDNWRDALVPELHKRGLLIEVGGHGYQTYLPPEKYIDQHPDWFGMHDGQRSRQDFEVFATSNPDAVRTLIENIRAYLAAHPEIDIFDLWPPDGARWSEAPADTALGSPSERQALLLNEVARQLAPQFPKLRIQFIAYQTYVTPPALNKPAPNILMEFCPINRSFESALYEGATLENAEYFHALETWSNGIIDPSSITIYSYIPKYAWRSLPMNVPHMILDEARKYREMKLGGIATYSEPGNWATFEIDHYVMAKALWNPAIDSQQLLDEYFSTRYGPAGSFVQQYFQLVEEVVPHAVAIPGTDRNEPKQKAMLAFFAPAAQRLRDARAAAHTNPAVLLLLDKVDDQYRYVYNEMELQLVLLQDDSRHTTSQMQQIADLLNERKRILATARDGVILSESQIP